MYLKYKKNEKKYINIINNMVKKDNVIKKFTIIQLGNGDNGEEIKPQKIVRLGSLGRLNFGDDSSSRVSTNLFGTQNNPPRTVRLRPLGRLNFEDDSSSNLSNNETEGDSKESIPIKNEFMDIVISKEKITQENIIIPDTVSDKIFILPNKIIKFFTEYEILYLQKIKENLETNDYFKNFLPIYKIDQMYNVDGINYYYVEIEKFGESLNKKISSLISDRNYQDAINLRLKSFDIVRSLIDYLHSKNLYHGDLIRSDGMINDGNILVNDKLEFKIIDFGKVDMNKPDALIINYEKDGLIKMENNNAYRRKIKGWEMRMNKRRKITRNYSDFF